MSEQARQAQVSAAPGSSASRSHMSQRSTSTMQSDVPFRDHYNLVKAKTIRHCRDEKKVWLLVSVLNL